MNDFIARLVLLTLFFFSSLCSHTIGSSIVCPNCDNWIFISCFSLCVCVFLCVWVFSFRLQFFFLLKPNFWNFPFDLCVCEIMWSNDKTKISLWFACARHPFSTCLFSIFQKQRSLLALVRNQNKQANKQTKAWNSWSTATVISDKMFWFKLFKTNQSDVMLVFFFWRGCYYVFFFTSHGF